MDSFKLKIEKLEDALAHIQSGINDLEERLRFKIMLISEEIITNQLRHADYSGKTPEIFFFFDKNNGVLTFKDNALKFNPLEKETPDLNTPLEETSPGGLGIFLVKQYARDIKYSYKEGFNVLKVYL
jgi:anti-sigma regulatory factor (Ser/Thr protein kinase)